MKIEDFEVVQKFKTFQELENLFIQKTKGKDLREIDGTYFLASYVFLNSDSWIIQDGGYEALQAGNRCREIVLKTNSVQIKDMDKIIASAFVLPLEKFMLPKCDTYRKLESLFLAETFNVRDLSEFDGNYYAKQFWHILNSGPIGKIGNINEEPKAFNNCVSLITQTQLSDAHRQQMSKDVIIDKVKDYTGERDGCLGTMIFFALAFSSLIFSMF